MIISASRRTDIPAFYSEWFIKRLREGFAYIKNPRNSQRIASVQLNADVVDCIVFWTKNTQPMLSQLDTIDTMGYPYFFNLRLRHMMNRWKKDYLRNRKSWRPLND
jgi:hypothetical protein